MTDTLTFLSNGDYAIALHAEKGEMAAISHIGAREHVLESKTPRLACLPASPDKIVPVSLCPMEGKGFFGRPGFTGYLINVTSSFDFHTFSIETSQSEATLCSQCHLTELSLTHHIRLNDAGVLEARCTLKNTTQHLLHVQSLASLVIEIPENLSQIIQRRGKWAFEGEQTPQEIYTGIYEKTSRGGRVGFNGAAHIAVADIGASEERGTVLAATLSWSGDTSVMAEKLVDGRVQLQLSRLIMPGEIILQPGETYETPSAYLAHSSAGKNDIRRAFHRTARAIAPKTQKRPLQFNSWEALYFKLSEQKLKELATHCADIGIERFVLDDGWFNGRRDDTSALGDWSVDKGIFAHGLTPLISHIKSCGLEFGLWVEPEMISPRSELYKKHPDWCLHIDGLERRTGRTQLALDVAKPKVAEHIYNWISDLLNTHDISYIKWDHNRALYPASSDNIIGSGARLTALYSLLNRIRNNFPQVEIEACASGAARLDFGILPYVTRFWTSDNTDAIERVRIQESASQFLPIEMLGAHIGPSPNPMTGHVIPIEFRILVAFFTHMGLEADPRDLCEKERETLTRAFTLYKRYRHLIIAGAYHVLDTPDDLHIDYVGHGNEKLIRILMPPERSVEEETCGEYVFEHPCLKGNFQLLFASQDGLGHIENGKILVGPHKGHIGALYYCSD